MKSPFKTLLLLAVFALGAGALRASDRLFAVVPNGDATYVQLKRLESLGLVPKGVSDKSLTRYEVAQLIFRARETYDVRRGVRLAQAEMPPPPDFGSDADIPDFGGADMLIPSGNEVISTTPAVPVATADAAKPTGPDTTVKPTGPAEVNAATGETSSSNPDSVVTPTSPAAPTVQAQEALTSLEAAYQAELKALQGDVKQAADRTKKLEEDQFKVWRRIRAIETGSAIRLNGLGRVFTNAIQIYRTPSVNAHNRYQSAFLDMNPNGTVSKEVRWGAVIRVGSSMNPPNAADLFTIRRLAIDFNPAWISGTLGDFDESYTPLTLWNRSYVDLQYAPEMVSRWSRYEQYESCLDRPFFLPFRGLKAGTAVMWKNSKTLNEWNVSTFAHMVRSGYNKGFLPQYYSGWIFGAQSGLQAFKVFRLDAHGVMIDEPLNTDDPAAAYLPFTASSWAQNYKVGSLKPQLELHPSLDWTVGARYEMAFSIYQDDKLDSQKKVKDYARQGGPYIQYKGNSLRFNFVDNGSAFYSPLAQLRQLEDSTTKSLFTGGTMVSYPFMLSVSRPVSMFSFYNRGTDNVFPYGMASPNRQGAGLETEIKALKNDAFQVKGAYYQVKEKSGNLVVDPFFLDFVPVDGWGNSPAAIRDYKYVNVGPRLNLAPFMNLKRDLELGFNFRSENTESWIGTLKSSMILVGLRCELNSWLEWEVAAASVKVDGREAGYKGQLLARYQYLYSNEDLGDYSVVEVDNQEKDALSSITFKIGNNSKLNLDVLGNWLRTANGSMTRSSTGRLVYEIVF